MGVASECLRKLRHPTALAVAGLLGVALGLLAASTPAALAARAPENPFQVSAPIDLGDAAGLEICRAPVVDAGLSPRPDGSAARLASGRFESGRVHVASPAGQSASLPSRPAEGIDIPACRPEGRWRLAHATPPSPA